jgi:rod shape-determining protein MreC
VGALLEKTRLQGVLRGTANGEVVLERVMADEQVQVGENLLTSGGDQIFPKGLPVGTVTRVGNGKDLFLTIKIKPAANLSELEEVMVLVEKKERQTTAEENVRVRAADILAQRLPSVPDKPATDAKSATEVKPATEPTQGSATPAVNKAPAKPLSAATITAPSKNQSEAANAPSAAGQAAKAPADGTTPNVKKSGGAAGGAGVVRKPDASQASPTLAQPKPNTRTAPTTPPEDAKPAADESSPQ